MAEDLGGLELMRATFVSHRFAKHSHETYAIGVIEGGVQRFSKRGATHTAPSGSVIISNPEEAHTGQAAVEGGYTYRMLYPGADLLRAALELAGKEGGEPLFRASVVRDAPVAVALRDAHAALEGPSPRLEGDSRLLGALARLVSRHASDRRAGRGPGRERRAVALAQEYLEDNLAEDVSLEELSRAVHLSRFHLLRVFREEVGLPPHAYLTQARLKRARALLAAGTPIARAARETGFVDQSHLTKRFKALHGYTPGGYLRSLNGRA